MKQLSELVGLLGTDHLMWSYPVPDDGSKGSLLEYLRQTEDPTAEEAAARLGLDPGEPAFRKAKHQLKIDLINSLTALMPAPKAADRRKRKADYVWKLIAIGKQLRTTVGSEVLLPFLEEAHRSAARLDMVVAAALSATMLRRQYANRHFDSNKYEYYTARAAQYQEISREYEDAVADLNDLLYLRNMRRDPEGIAVRAEEALLRHRHLVKKHDIAMLSYIVFLIEVNRYVVVKDYEGVIAVSNRALAYLANRENTPATMFQVFEANLSVAYAQLNDYARGTDFARRLLARTDPGDYNYIKVYELILMLALRAGRFQEAYDTFLSIRPDTLTNNLLSYYNETFRIIEAYLYLLVRMEQIEVAPGDETFSRFRLSRFLNSFDHVPGEKSHRNVHLLIIEIVYQIIQRRHNKTTHTIESITKYANRHLRGPDYRRVRYFLKALTQLSAQQFHRAAVERHTKRYVKAMEDHPLNESRLDYYMEVVPYETVWRLILEQLGYKRIRQAGGSKNSGK